jgi:hypothetical protein
VVAPPLDLTRWRRATPAASTLERFCPDCCQPAHSGQVRHPVCRNGHYTAKADGSNWSPGTIGAESDARRPLRGYRCEASSMWDATKLQGTVKLQPGVSEGGDRAGRHRSHLLREAASRNNRNTREAPRARERRGELSGPPSSCRHCHKGIIRTYPVVTSECTPRPLSGGSNGHTNR